MSAPQKLGFTRGDYLRFLAILLTTSTLLFVVLVGAIYALQDEIPAPQLSTSESFNEKVRWIRNFSAHKCDVLIVGSSIALNNMDGSTIKRLAPNLSVMNVGSWGLTVSESAKLLRHIAPICKPKLIIYAAFYGDFDRGLQDEKEINWELFKTYISGGSVVITYLKSLNPMYYISIYNERRALKKKGGSIYGSLEFDDTGSVMLDCSNFEIDSHRWDNYRNHNTLHHDRIRRNLSELENIENAAIEYHSQLLVVATPLRKVAVEALTTPEMAALWNSVLHSVNKTGGTFVNISASHGFDDDKFADFAHLNKCGAGQVAKVIAPALSRLSNEVQ